MRDKEIKNGLFTTYMDFLKVENNFLDLLFVPVRAIKLKIWIFQSTFKWITTTVFNFDLRLMVSGWTLT